MSERMRETDSPECAAFEAIVHSVLDGDRSVADLEHSHANECDPCRELASSARLLSAGLSLSSLAPPIDFASRVIPSVLANRQRERAIRRTIVAVAASLAACVMVAVFASPQPSSGPSLASKSTSTEPKPPQVVESFRLAGSAFVSLTKRAASESLEPAKNLLVGIERPDPPLPVTRPMELSIPATSPVEPITNTAKRAINLFIRDVGGLAPSSNMKS